MTNTAAGIRWRTTRIVVTMTPSAMTVIDSARCEPTHDNCVSRCVRPSANQRFTPLSARETQPPRIDFDEQRRRLQSSRRAAPRSRATSAIAPASNRMQSLEPFRQTSRQSVRLRLEGRRFGRSTAWWSVRRSRRRVARPLRRCSSRRFRTHTWIRQTPERRPELRREPRLQQTRTRYTSDVLLVPLVVLVRGRGPRRRGDRAPMAIGRPSSPRVARRTATDGRARHRRRARRSSFRLAAHQSRARHRIAPHRRARDHVRRRLRDRCARGARPERLGRRHDRSRHLLVGQRSHDSAEPRRAAGDHPVRSDRVRRARRGRRGDRRVHPAAESVDRPVSRGGPHRSEPPDQWAQGAARPRSPRAEPGGPSPGAVVPERPHRDGRGVLGRGRAADGPRPRPARPRVRSPEAPPRSRSPSPARASCSTCTGSRTSSPGSPSAGLGSRSPRSRSAVGCSASVHRSKPRNGRWLSADAVSTGRLGVDDAGRPSGSSSHACRKCRNGRASD